MADVLFGNDDFLFLSTDTNGLLNQHCGRVVISDRINDLYRIHLERAFATQRIGGKYLHIVVPNKETVAHELLPEPFRYEIDGPTPVRQYLQAATFAADMTYFNPDALKAFREQGLFYRYDTHWTTRGALTYLHAAFVAAGMPEAAEALTQIRLSPGQDASPGDLGSKVGLPSEGAETLSVLEHHMQFHFTNHISNEGCIRHFTRLDAPVRKRVLFVHDSTAMWLVFIVAELFSELLMIHTADIDLDFVARYKPDLLVFMQIERFLPRVPQNNANYAELIAREAAEKGTQGDGVVYLKAAGYL